MDISCCLAALPRPSYARSMLCQLYYTSIVLVTLCNKTKCSTLLVHQSRSTVHGCRDCMDVLRRDWMYCSETGCTAERDWMYCTYVLTKAHVCWVMIICTAQPDNVNCASFLTTTPPGQNNNYERERKRKNPRASSVPSDLILLCKSESPTYDNMCCRRSICRPRMRIGLFAGHHCSSSHQMDPVINPTRDPRQTKKGL